MRMDTSHPRWNEFVERLEGPEGCNFHESVPGDVSSVQWTCAGGNDKALATKILKGMNFSARDISASLKFFDEHGGHCDCEILFNVNV